MASGDGLTILNGVALSATLTEISYEGLCRLVPHLAIRDIHVYIDRGFTLQKVIVSSPIDNWFLWSC